MLQRLGLRADLAADGSEAVHMSGLVAYDLILMDCQMPEMDGFTAAREIRSRNGDQRPPVIIALTAETLDGLPRTMSGCRNGRLPFEARHIGCIDGNAPKMDSHPPK
jgi:CheY-like chemotaxis protein